VIEQSNRKENAAKWRDRVERAEIRSGTIPEFCKQEGISVESLSYWRRRFTQVHDAPKPTVSYKSQNPFARVELRENSAPSVRVSHAIDARWIAEFVFQLQQLGGSR
jgi:hypothetical protein